MSCFNSEDIMNPCLCVSCEGDIWSVLEVAYLHLRLFRQPGSWGQLSWSQFLEIVTLQLGAGGGLHELQGVPAALVLGAWVSGGPG